MTVHDRRAIEDITMTLLNFMCQCARLSPARDQVDEYWGLAKEHLDETFTKWGNRDMEASEVEIRDLTVTCNALRKAIEKHRRDTWGDDGPVKHPNDQELYAILNEKTTEEEEYETPTDRAALFPGGWYDLRKNRRLPPSGERPLDSDRSK